MSFKRVLQPLAAFCFLSFCVDASAQVVISQAYGGGGNGGSTYKNDFIELFNNSATAVSLDGWAIQYHSAGGSGNWTNKTNLPNVTLQPGQYYLIQQAAGAGGTADLPAPDLLGTIAMGGSGFKIALTNTTTSLSGACPSGAMIVDFLGAAKVHDHEGMASAPAPSNSNSVQRKLNGCQDTNSNTDDFIAAVAYPNARNSLTALNPCVVSGGAPGVDTTTPADNATGVLVNSNITIEFTESVAFSNASFQLR